MNKTDFMRLLQKYLRGEATKEEERFIVNYYNLFENEPDVTGVFSEAGKEQLKNQLQTAIWDTISQLEPALESQQTVSEGQALQAPVKKAPVIYRLRLTRIAAAVLLVVSASGFYLLHRMSVRKQAEIQAESLVTLTNQKQENHLVSLPDGSTVVLSFGSKLDYPSSFDGLSKREVYLEGQAFFDIRHNAAKTFIVHTGRLATTVLGTTFNVKAFSSERDITVTVRSGQVKVSDENKTLGIIQPSQQIIYDKTKAFSTKTAVATESYLEWKGRDLLFDNLTVAEAANLLEERYRVKISINDPAIAIKRFTTTFSKKENLEEALESICEFNGAVFHYDREKAVVVIGNR